MVVFCSQRTEVDAGYDDLAQRIETLARGSDGFLDVMSVRQANGLGITVSWWSSAATARAFGAAAEHRDAQALGREALYAWYTTDVATITRTLDDDAS